MVGAYVQLKEEETVVFAPKSLQYECKKKRSWAGSVRRSWIVLIGVLGSSLIVKFLGRNWSR